MSKTENINSQAQEEKDLELYEVYELGYHILPDVPEAELESKVADLKALVESFGGEIFMDAEPKLIDLAYTMIVPRGGHNDKYDKAYFGWMKFEAPKKNIPELQKELKIKDYILRFILFKTVKEDTRANLDLPELKQEDNDSSVADLGMIEEDEMDKKLDSMIESEIKKSETQEGEKEDKE